MIFARTCNVASVSGHFMSLSLLRVATPFATVLVYPLLIFPYICANIH